MSNMHPYKACNMHADSLGPQSQYEIICNLCNVLLFNLTGVVSKKHFEGRYGSKTLLYLNLE